MKRFLKKCTANVEEHFLVDDCNFQKNSTGVKSERFNGQVNE